MKTHAELYPGTDPNCPAILAPIEPGVQPLCEVGATRRAPTHQRIELALMVSQPPIAFHRTCVAIGRAVQLNHGMCHQSGQFKRIEA